MPQVVVEYTDNIKAEADIPALLEKINDTIIRYAAMIGISTVCTACTNNSPIPGHWNTVSVMIANAITEPNCSPATVITGTRVFLSAWPKWMARVVSPRARAKRI